MIDILMPRLSDTMEEGAISVWRKKPGDPVTPGDILVEIETDKAVMEHEAYEAGVLAEILVAEGNSAPIGSPIARIDDGNSTSDDDHDSASDGKNNGDGDQPGSTTHAPATRPERRLATPLVRRLAKERGIDLATVTGTGPGGRIVRADLDVVGTPAASAAPAAPPTSADGPTTTAALTSHVAPYEPEPAQAQPATPFDPVRRAIADRVTASATIPAFTVTASADVEELVALRAQINSSLDGTGQKVTINDLLVRAAALSLREHPGVNASYSPAGQGQTLVHSRVSIGLAIASPAGLMVPVIHDADRVSVTAISNRTRELADRAANRSLSTTDMADGTFTISNLGMYGVDHFTALIIPPQGAILAVGAAKTEVRLRDGNPVERRQIRYTITVDHRIIDGALAAQFLQTLTTLLEHPIGIVA